MGDEIHLEIGNEINQVSTAQNYSWAVEIDEKVSRLESSQKTKQNKKRKCSIYKIPAKISKTFDYSDYAPSMVSFGPYYHGHESCQLTEDIKEKVVIHSLNRSKKTANDYIEALREVVQDQRGQYDELDPVWEDTESFLKLMIYDGCFLLDILRIGDVSEDSSYYLDLISHWNSPIWDVNGISQSELIEYYRHDMLLLENQIPMLVLEKLLSVQDNLSISAAQKDLYDLILRLIAPSSPNIAKKLLKEDKECMYLHVLDLYRHSLLYDQEHGGRSIHEILFNILWATFPVDDDNLIISCAIHLLCFPVHLFMYLSMSVLLILTFLVVYIFLALRYIMELKRKPDTATFITIPSAIELDKVGIEFVMNKTESLKDISFGGIYLRLPWIYIDGATQSRFLNIIAFDRLHADAKNEITVIHLFNEQTLPSCQ